MKVIALISGGKDSTFAISEALSQGHHELVGLAHLASFSLQASLLSHASSSSTIPLLQLPGHSHESDSWMYQSVGSELVPLLAICFEKPLFWLEPSDPFTIDQEEEDYLKAFGASAFVKADGHLDSDVVRLWRLLKSAKEQLSSDPSTTPQGLVSGAILSNYQRTRVEVICRALGWTSIAPLWERDQIEVLDSMASPSAAIDARIIKCASIGIDSSHLMQSLLDTSTPNSSGASSSSSSSSSSASSSPSYATSPLPKTLRRLFSQYGVNPCGEGGEYESFTLDTSVFPHLRILPISWSTQSHHEQDEHASADMAHVSWTRFQRVALVEKKENSLSLFGEFGKILASVTVPYSKASQWVLSPVATKFEESKIEDLERTLSASALSEKRGIKGVIEGLISSGRIIVVPGSLTHPPVPGKDLNRPVARNALKSEAGVDALKVSGPHFRQAGSLAGSLRGIDPQPIGANYSSKWLPSNFYIEASHNVNEACIEGVDLAKDISQATQAVMNSIGRRLAEESLSFRDVYFASLIIPSMSFFGEMNPVYSSYFVPTQNPPSRVTVAQQPRHSQKISASSSASPSVQPSIRVQFWGLHPKLVNPSIESSLALSPDSFAAHNVLHVESYSGWAPACIGPYSQAHEVLGVDHMAGQIALEPTSMVLQAPSIPNDQSEAYIFERTLVELKLALKHVYSLVKARCSVSIGIAKTSMPSHLLFSSMYTSVPIDMAIRCIQKLESEGTKEEQETVALVLRGATLLKVDQLPRLAAVEIQTIVDSPDSPMYSPTNSNLIIHNAEQVEKGLIKEGSRLSSVQTSHPTLNVPITVETRRSISRSRSFAHFQLAVYGSKDTRWDGKSLGEFLSGLAFPQILASLGLSSQPSSSSSSSDFPQALLSAELFYPINIEDEDANAVMYSVRNSIHAQNIDITPCAALELSSYGWDNTMTTPDRECKAVLHAKFALTMEIDD